MLERLCYYHQHGDIKASHRDVKGAVRDIQLMRLREKPMLLYTELARYDVSDVCVYCSPARCLLAV